MIVNSDIRRSFVCHEAHREVYLYSFAPMLPRFVLKLALISRLCLFKGSVLTFLLLFQLITRFAFPCFTKKSFYYLLNLMMFNSVRKNNFLYNILLNKSNS